MPVPKPISSTRPAAGESTSRRSLRKTRWFITSSSTQGKTW